MMYKFHLPTTGPLSHPHIRSYLRKQILSIRSHYKRTYFKCSLIMDEGFHSWYAVYSLVVRSAIDLRLFTVFSLIVCVTDNGKSSIPLEKLFSTFRGIFPKYFITKCWKRLEKIGFIKIYAYNPFDPSPPPCKHITLTGPGVYFYESFVAALRSYILSPMEDLEDPDYPAVRLPTVPDGHILRF